MTDNMQNDVTI